MNLSEKKNAITWDQHIFVFWLTQLANFGLFEAIFF